VDDDAIAAMKFRFPDPPRSGKVVVKAVDVAKSFGSNEVFRSVDFEILRGEKVAFVGKNGMGKTTLSKCIADQLDFEGDLTLGSNLSLGFFAQHQAETIPGDKTVFETVDDKATGDMRTKVRGLLGAFLFQGDEVNKKVKVLSGGERSRLVLALLMLEPHNLLILDEPTNHLDMQSKTILKEAIQHFTGTVIIVSHDRDFLNGLTQRVFEFNHHTVKPHIGDISDFLALKKAESMRKWERVEKESERTVNKDKKVNDYALRKSLAKIERKIEKLEAKINEMNQALQDPAQYSQLQSDEAFLNRYNQKVKDLDKLNEEWEELADQID
jgi:ATP-binding cassette subfamily F protein 3